MGRGVREGGAVEKLSALYGYFWNPHFILSILNRHNWAKFSVIVHYEAPKKFSGAIGAQLASSNEVLLGMGMGVREGAGGRASQVRAPHAGTALRSKLLLSARTTLRAPCSAGVLPIAP